MAGKEKLTPTEVVAALKATEGMIFLAADQLKVAASTVWRYSKRHPSVKDCIEHLKGKRLDTAESVLWNAVLAGEAWAVCFYLKTQGKARGYVERQEFDTVTTNRLVIEEEIVGDPPAEDSVAPQAGRILS